MTRLVALLLVARLAVVGCDDGIDPEPDGGTPATPRDFAREHAIPLDTLDPTEPFDDLEPLRPLFEDRAVVMLGEGDHGVAEARESKLRLIAFLYLELGFATYTEEMGIAEARLVDEYLATGDEGFLDRLDTNDFDNYFRVVEVREFHRGLRALVESRPEGHPRLRARGFDLDHGRRNAIEEVLAYVEPLDTTLHDELSALLVCVSPTTDCEAAQEDALAALDDASAALIAASSEEAFARARRVQQNHVDTARYQRLGADGDESRNAFREEAMMRHADEDLASAPEGLILGAHNLHVGRRFSAIDGYWRTLGEHLADDHGDGVYSLAMTFRQGTHLVRTTGGFEVRVVQDVPFQYLESILADVDAPMFVLDLGLARDADPAADWLLEPRDLLINGYTGFLRAAPAEQWDGVLFIERVTATTLP